MRHSLLECVSQPEIAKKFTKTPYFRGSTSFKVIDVGTLGKLVSSAYYDKQQICLPVTVLGLDELITVK